jgi:L-threonylcarbamoyladenylate synthase
VITDDPRAAAAALLDGALVVLPTETVYGLAGRADDAAAVARIYAVKGRPSAHPVIVHVADTELDPHRPGAWISDVPDYARALAAACWPGPLTLVLPRSARATDDVTGGQETVAIRVPSHPVARAVIGAMDQLDPSGAPHGVAAPSANRFGHVSPTTLDHALGDLSDRLGPGDLALDGGAADVGVESTIVDCTGPQPRVLRPGGIGVDEIERITGLDVLGSEDAGIRVPGALPSHYAPAASVALARDPEALMAYVDAATEGGLHAGRIGIIATSDVDHPPGTVRLLAPDSPEAYAQGLYDALRRADAQGLSFVVALLPSADSAGVSSSGISDAIADRLRRASAPR